MNISPENLGYLVLALCKNQQSGLSARELAQDKWIKWSLAEGWAKWEGQGEQQRLSFAPLWQRLYNVYQKQQGEKQPVTEQEAEFNYGKILKWLDQARGTLSSTWREKKAIQEMNLKYGWSTDFILIFLQLVFERGLVQVSQYHPIAKRVHESGIYTVNDLVAFINELDWTHFKVAEVKKCIGQYGGITRPQREMYLQWSKQFNFHHELIMRAAQETVRTNNPSFKYIDAILRDWHQKNVTDIKGAEDVLAGYSKENDSKVKKNVKRYSKAGNRDIEKMYGLE